jgi:hypothetical protein
LAHLVQFSLATDEWSELRGKAGGSSAARVGTDGWHARCHLETDAVGLRQPQRIGEALHGISVWPPVLPALEETDSIYTQPGPLG